MTVDEVQKRMDEACHTLMRLHVPGVWPATQNRSMWPAYPMDLKDWFAAMLDPAMRDAAKADLDRMASDADRGSGPPSAAEISRMDEVMPDWFMLVRDEKHRHALRDVSLLRAREIWNPYAKLAKRTGMSRDQIRMRYNRALGDIVVGLKKSVRVVRANHV